MFRNYFKIIFRNFFSDGMYSSIIVTGLAVGIAVSLIIGQYVYFELSFDKQYKDRDRIYYTYMNWQEQQGAQDMNCHPAIGPMIEKTIPEAESAIRIVPIGIERGDEWILRRVKDGELVKYSRTDKMYRADDEIFEFFSIPMIEGDPKTALKDPSSIVITRSIADLFFPGESPLDKTLMINLYTEEFKITGVIEDASPNSSLQYNVFFSMNRANWNIDSNWTQPRFQTFIKLGPSADYQLVEKKINEAAAPNLSILQKKYNIDESIRLYPFRDFHFYKPFNSTGTSPVAFTGDKRMLGFFAALAILILIISWSNYINLTIARALRRAKEVGLRKVNGAARRDLVFQFLLEFFLFNAISLLLAFTITQLVFNSFAVAIGSAASWALWKEPIFWLCIVAFLVFSTVVSGVYPAMVMANYNPVKVLKGSFSRSQSGARLRRALVLIQFGMSAVLLMGIYVTFRQLVFMQNKDLGLATEQVLVVRLTDLPKDMNPYTAFERWKSVVHNQKNVKSVAVVSNYPGDFEARSQSYYPTAKPDNKSFLDFNFVSEDYFKTMNIPFLAGHTFNDDLSTDTTGVIINEDAVYQLGFDNPEEALGQGVTFTAYDFQFEIIGVVKNFSTDLKSTPRNSSFHHRKFDYFLRYFVIKLSTNDLQTTMADLEQSWKEMFNDSPLDYFFLDDYFNTFYKSEMQFASVFGFFSIVGVVITCMGLFGLSMYNTNSRTKEIGIRKSLGSSSRGIIWLLSKEYLRLVLVAGVICIPVGAWLLNNWLKNYPQRIEFGADFILAPLALMILIAQFTVGYQTYKAAHSNPVTSLRNE